MKDKMLKIAQHLFALAAVMASTTAFGQPNDFAEQLILSNEEQFTRIFPVGVDNSKLMEKIERSVHLLTAAIERKLPTDAADEAKDELAKQQANAAVVLLRMNQPAKVWPLLKHSPDPSARSYLIHRMGPLGVDAKIIIKRLEVEPDITIRRALVLSLGEFDDNAVPLEDRTALIPKLQEMYRTDADPGLHAAAEWLLRKWKQEDWLKQVNEEWAKDKSRREKRLEGIQQLLSKDKEKTPPQWYVNGQGQTMVVIPGPVEFMMGSPTTEVGRFDSETQHKRRIGRMFAIAAASVTVEQYGQFEKDYSLPAEYTQLPNLPAAFIDWYRGARYANWLSEQEGLPADQWCYEITGDQIKLKASYLSLSGYRLPTEAEMEYAARAGALTGRYFEETDELLSKYAWHSKNSNEKIWPVGNLKPNDLGLFDVQGIVWTWCQESFKDYPQGVEAEEDQEDGLEIVHTTGRVLRGGSFLNQSSILRSAYRTNFVPTPRSLTLGFRLARTLPVAPHSDLPNPQKGENEKMDK